MGFGRLLSSIGIGAATVDTKLEKSEFVPGEEVRGVVEIKGGGQEQMVDGIYISVKTRFSRTAGSDKALGTVERFPVAPRLTVQPGSREEVSFSFRLPYDTPLSIGRSEVWIETGLDVKSAFDPSDKDRITVRPNRWIQTVLDAIERLGFDLRQAENETLPDRFQRRLTFGQEFEFVPRRGEFSGRLGELELVMFPSEGQIDLIMQVDRRGFGGESHAQLMVSESETSQVAETLAQVIRQHS